MRTERKREERKHWVLSDEVKEGLIRDGHPEDVHNQFIIDKMMEMDDFVKKHGLPTREELDRLDREANSKTDE